jgi:hypothetical protein
MNKFLQAFVMVVLATTITYAQWTYVEDFFVGSAPHGVVVDPDGKVWISQFAANDTLSNGFVASGIHVFNPDGSEASFSPVTTFTINGVPDTLRYNNRGMTLDSDGNILTCSGFLYKINYQTGEGIARFDYNGAVQALTEPGVDENGFKYITRVVPGGDPIMTLDADMTLYGFAVDSNFTISRTLAASADGTHLFHGAIYPGVGVIHYFSQFGPDGTYATVDTIRGPNPARNVWGQILDWDLDGYLWVGTYWDVEPDAYTGWYKLNVHKDGTYTNNQFLDSLGFNMGINPSGGPVPPPADSFYAPRGVAFWQNPTDGKVYAYTADFDGGVVKKWVQGPTGIISVNDDNVLVRDFVLEQNYPNPFNPSTKIPFKLRKTAHVKLEIFNIAGQLVRTLVDEPMQPGTYEYEFDATGLSSGTYFYRISFNGEMQTNRMMFTK